MKLESEFVFTVCQVGAEPALKKELARRHPELRFAFSRPGYVTFKNTLGAVSFDFAPQSVFARAFGVSLGSYSQTDFSRVFELAQSLRSLNPNKKIRLHFWERDQYLPGDEPLGYSRGSFLSQFEQTLRAQDLKHERPFFEVESSASVGDWVIHVMGLDPGRFALGCSDQTASHSAWPGARPEIVLPEQAPSRAYLKLEEALRWSHAPLRSGDCAVEIGSAPGGASFALLQRGVQVIGIDPGKMDPQILKHPQYTHLSQPVNAVMREDLPESIQWVLLDMNVEPNVSIYAVDRLVSRMQDSLLGVILTIKLNQWKFADEIPYLLEHVQAMGMLKPQAAQLSYHRQEFLIYGLTRKGMMRAQIKSGVIKR